VIVVSRNKQKCAATVDWIREKTGNLAVDYAVVDLSNQVDIERFVRSIHTRFDRLDVLINNAGAFFLNRRENAAGVEMTFALNHLGYFSPTLLLLDLLRVSPEARVINVSSGSHRNAHIHFEDLQYKDRYRPFEAYGQSKLANILFTHELDRRLERSNVTVNALHPGVVATNIASDNLIIGNLARIVMGFIGKSAEEGAQTPIYLAADNGIKGVTGKYFVECEQVRSAPHSYDVDAEQRLWDISLELTGLEDPTI
jgi:NAD(P)-dependent dehydrogenase (short-subunit alcohol dehydrogenase family)